MEPIPTPHISRENREDAIQYIRERIAAGDKPVVTVPKEYVETIKQKGLSEHPTWIAGVARIAGTLGREPYGETGRARLQIEVNEDDLEPRFTGPDVSFQGVVGFKDKHISPDRIHLI